MKYDAYWTWTVQGAPTFQFELIGATTTDLLGVLPGTAAPIAFGVTGYANYDDCTAANRALPPLDFDFAGGQLGLWQNDFKPEDNTAGVRARCGGCRASRVRDVNGSVVASRACRGGCELAGDYSFEAIFAGSPRNNPPSQTPGITGSMPTGCGSSGGKI